MLFVTCWFSVIYALFLPECYVCVCLCSSRLAEHCGLSQPVRKDMNEPRCMVRRMFCWKCDPHPMQQIPSTSWIGVTAQRSNTRAWRQIHLTSPTKSLYIHLHLTPSFSQICLLCSSAVMRCESLHPDWPPLQGVMFTSLGNEPAGFRACT